MEAGFIKNKFARYKEHRLTPKTAIKPIALKNLLIICLSSLIFWSYL
jgi:hypothetical protein